MWKCIGPDRALQEVRLLRAQYSSLIEENRVVSAAADDGLELTTLDQAINAARQRRRRADVDFQLKVLEDTQLCLNLSEQTVSLQYRHGKVIHFHRLHKKEQCAGVTGCSWKHFLRYTPVTESKRAILYLPLFVKYQWVYATHDLRKVV